jgi:hypothetical protein
VLLLTVRVTLLVYNYMTFKQPQSNVLVYCCRLLFTKRHSAYHVQRLTAQQFTVQILYKLYSLQLNCTYSNYTEAAATRSAAQQHTKRAADVF